MSGEFGEDVMEYVSSDLVTGVMPMDGGIHGHIRGRSHLRRDNRRSERTSAPPRPAEALPPPPVNAIGYDPRHYDWGVDRYQSYRAYDNTFQPYEGSRRQRRSPFG